MSYQQTKPLLSPNVYLKLRFVLNAQTSPSSVDKKVQIKPTLEKCKSLGI